MAWDFETDPEYQEKLDWADEFVREEVEPLDYVFPHLQFVPLDDTRRKIIDPLKEEVRRQGLWATHLGPELGGQGYGQLKLALLNEILGPLAVGADRVRHARRPTPATPRSSPTTARRSRRSATCSRCSTARCSPATR